MDNSVTIQEHGAEVRNGVDLVTCSHFREWDKVVNMDDSLGLLARAM
jgi:hypothetical protein